jgi:integrase
MLSKALTDAVRVERILSVNPVQNATLPRVRSAELPAVWSPLQLRAFLSTAAEHRLGAFYRLAAYTGARRGEMLHLRWSDVDLAGAEVTFAGSTAVVDKQRVEGSTKADRPRVVSIDAGTVESLQQHRRAQITERLAAGAFWCDDDGMVIRRSDGRPLYPSTVSALMGTLATKANVPPARLHDLRHVHATTLLLAGVPVHVVAARLGHADPAITLRIYAHVLREQAAGVADVFASAIENAS